MARFLRHQRVELESVETELRPVTVVEAIRLRRDVVVIDGDGQEHAGAEGDWAVRFDGVTTFVSDADFRELYLPDEDLARLLLDCG